MQQGKQLLKQINEARAHPQDCIEDIKQQLARFESNNVMRTRKGDKLRVLQGKSAWQDAILYLQRSKPKPPLTWSPQLGQTAQAYLSIRTTSDPNPFKLLKSRYNYEASTSFNVNESEVNSTLRELVIGLIVGDGDEKKGNRMTLFHPTFTHFGGVVAKEKQGSFVPMYFAETGKFQRREGGGGVGGAGNQKEQVKGNKMVYTDRGKELVVELNRIRKDPKSIINALKTDMGKFKQDKTLVKDNVILKTKQGKDAYQDLISQLQQQYPIPALKLSQGLCTAASDQVLQLESLQQGQQKQQTNYLTLVKKYCSAADGISNIIMNRSEDDTYTNMIILLLVGDGDKKRTARRKLLSPVLKVVGGAVGEDYFVVNVGEAVRDNKEAIEQARAQQQGKKESTKEVQKEVQKQLPKKSQQQPTHQQQQQRVIKKKTTKSRTITRGGKHYKVTVTSIQYADGQTQQVEEQQLLD